MRTDDLRFFCAHCETVERKNLSTSFGSTSGAQYKRCQLKQEDRLSFFLVPPRVCKGLRGLSGGHSFVALAIIWSASSRRS